MHLVEVFVPLNRGVTAPALASRQSVERIYSRIAGEAAGSTSLSAYPIVSGGRIVTLQNQDLELERQQAGAEIAMLAGRAERVGFVDTERVFLSTLLADLERARAKYAAR